MVMFVFAFIIFCLSIYSCLILRWINHLVHDFWQELEYLNVLRAISWYLRTYQDCMCQQVLLDSPLSSTIMTSSDALTQHVIVNLMKTSYDIPCMPALLLKRGRGPLLLTGKTSHSLCLILLRWAWNTECPHHCTWFAYAVFQQVSTLPDYSK